MRKQFLAFTCVNKLCLVMLCVIFALVIASCSTMTEEQNTFMRFNQIWQIDVDNVNQIEFSGREQYVDEYYTVFHIDDESKIFDSLVFETLEDESFEILIDRGVSNIEAYEIPDMYMPDWNKEYYWLHLVTKDTTNKTPVITYSEDLINMNNCDHLYLIYDLETNLLITLEIYI